MATPDPPYTKVSFRNPTGRLGGWSPISKMVGGGRRRAALSARRPDLDAVWEAERTGRPRVGVVDDDPSFREALAGWLRLMGLAPACFESAEAFLEEVDQVAWACLLIDVNMPGLNGLDLLAVLGRDGTPPPVIVISSQDDPATRTKALAGGALAFLSKPFDPACLEQLFRSIGLGPGD